METTLIRKQEAHAALPAHKRVAAYARVSSAKDEMLHSLAAQVSHYNSYIHSRPGWTFAGIYADGGITGTKSSRPEFTRMLDDCRAGKIDLALIGLAATIVVAAKEIILARNSRNNAFQEQ